MRLYVQPYQDGADTKYRLLTAHGGTVYADGFIGMSVAIAQAYADGHEIVSKK